MRVDVLDNAFLNVQMSSVDGAAGGTEGERGEVGMVGELLAAASGSTQTQAMGSQMGNRSYRPKSTGTVQQAAQRLFDAGAHPAQKTLERELLKKVVEWRCRWCGKNPCNALDPRLPECPGETVREMLAALRLAHQYLSAVRLGGHCEPGWLSEAGDAVRAAIAKATGGDR